MLLFDRIFLSSLTLCNTSSFLTWYLKLIFSILFQHHISKLSRYFWSTFLSDSMDSSALEANSCQSLPRSEKPTAIFTNPSQIGLSHLLKPSFPMISFNVILTSTPVFSRGCPSHFQAITFCACIPLLCLRCYCDSPATAYPNYIWWRVQIRHVCVFLDEGE